MDNGPPPKERWGTRVGVILAVTGSAVGLGNFLRFPGLAAKYGGGAFIIPYAVAFLLLGLPIAFTEWSLGRYGGSRGYNSTPGVFRTIWSNRAAPYVGVLGPLIPVMIYMYYVFIEAWCLGYAWKYLTGTMPTTGTVATGENGEIYNEFFGQFVGNQADGAIFDHPLDSAVIFLAICFVLNFALIYRGINKGIEWFCKWAMPALVVCALIVLVRVLTLPANPAHPDQNLVNGLGYMWNPSTAQKGFIETLSDPEIWLAAAGQIFFSLSIGFGVIITYASYLRREDDVALSSLTACAGNGFCEVALGGMIIIPAAFIFLGPAVVQNPPGTFGLGFITLPQVFESMPFGRGVGFLFFFLLFLAAVTSSLSMLQPAIALLEEGLGLARRASVAVLGMVTVLGTGFVVYFTKDYKALDTIDFWVGSVCIYILATIQVILFGWVLGVERGYDELQRGAEVRIPRFVMVIIKYVSPVYLLVIFFAWVYEKFYVDFIDPDTQSYLEQFADDRIVQFAVVLIGVVGCFFLLLIAQSVKRWNQADRALTEVSP